MDWVVLSIVSALLLGCYDAAKKWSVRDNAVPLVLLCSVSFGALLYLPLVLWSWWWPESIPWQRLVVGPLTPNQHALVMAKSVLVGASWTFAFFALQQLPLSIAAPIRATSPFWVILIATIAFGERPTAIQWLGMGVVLVGFWRFSLVGRREGIRFTRDRSVGLMIAATWLGACSSIYDKWLLQYAGLDPVTMQAWFTIDLVPVMIPLALRWLRGAVAERRRDRSWRPFRWRATILLVSPLLILADFFYFIAVANPEAMISVVSVLRRSSVVLALCFGARALSEANFRAKLACVGLILAGVVLLTWHG